MAPPSDMTLPLFGEDPRHSRTADVLFGAITVVTVLITIILSFTLGKVELIHIFFGVTITMIAVPQVILVKWFRDGDLHPKFRLLIGYMMVSIIALCACALAYFYKRKNDSDCP